MKNKKYLDFIRSLPCSVCGKKAQAHHVRDKTLTPSNLRGGTGKKPSDLMAIPLCHTHHEAIHNFSRPVFEKAFRISIARALIRTLSKWIEDGTE